ncbi:MAG TPA: hypothetical protein VGI18_01975 [Burkholderiales bacterium]
MVVLELPDEEPVPVEPELDPVLGVLGDVVLEPIPVEPELELPVEPVVLPAPLVLPYCWTHWSRSRPVLPTHWLGSEVLLLDEPVALGEDELELGELLLEPLVLGELLEPAPAEPLELGRLLEPLVPLLPVALGLDDEPPMLLPLLEDCAQETLARPTSAAATAALRILTFTIDAPI